jgi:hypothetical protein
MFGDGITRAPFHNAYVVDLTSLEYGPSISDRQGDELASSRATV